MLDTNECKIGLLAQRHFTAILQWLETQDRKVAAPLFPLELITENKYTLCEGCLHTYAHANVPPDNWTFRRRCFNQVEMSRKDLLCGYENEFYNEEMLHRDLYSPSDSLSNSCRYERGSHKGQMYSEEIFKDTRRYPSDQIQDASQTFQTDAGHVDATDDEVAFDLPLCDLTNINLDWLDGVSDIMSDYQGHSEESSVNHQFVNVSANAYCKTGTNSRFDVGQEEEGYIHQGRPTQVTCQECVPSYVNSETPMSRSMSRSLYETQPSDTPVIAKEVSADDTSRGVARSLFRSDSLIDSTISGRETTTNHKVQSKHTFYKQNWAANVFERWLEERWPPKEANQNDQTGQRSRRRPRRQVLPLLSDSQLNERLSLFLVTAVQGRSGKPYPRRSMYDLLMNVQGFLRRYGRNIAFLSDPIFGSVQAALRNATLNIEKPNAESHWKNILGDSGRDGHNIEVGRHKEKPVDCWRLNSHDPETLLDRLVSLLSARLHLQWSGLRRLKVNQVSIVRPDDGRFYMCFYRKYEPRFSQCTETFILY